MTGRRLIILLFIVTCAACKNSSDSPEAEVGVNSFDLDRLVGTWTEIERDSMGFFLYQPCDGNTPEVRISKDSIILVHQIEDATEMRIDSLIRYRDSIAVLASSNFREGMFVLKKIESEEDFLLFKLYFPKHNNRYKQIIMRIENSKAMRKVVDSCLTEKTATRHFLPIEYN